MFYKPDYFEFTKLLEANWLKIREELERLENDSFLLWSEKHLYNKDWTVFGLYDGYKKDRGKKIEENCALCPETAKLVETIPGMITAGFSRLSHGTHIRPHKGYEGNVLRCHLGLIVPDRCSINVNGKIKKWTEGKCMVFDDTYIHEAWNYGISTRVVLLMDIKKNALGIDISNDKYIEPMQWKDIIEGKILFIRYLFYTFPTLFRPIKLSRVLKRKFKKIMKKS